MQNSLDPNGYDFSFGNSIQSLKKPNPRPYFFQQDSINAISSTPKFAKIKDHFRSTKKKKVLKRKDSQQSLFGKTKQRSKSEMGFHFSLSASKSKINKIEINCNNYTNKSPVINYQRPKSFTPRVLSKAKYQKVEQNMYTPKGGFFCYYLTPSKSQKIDAFKKTQEKEPFQRKTFNRKQYIQRKMNNTKLNSQTSFSNKKTSPNKTRFRTLDIYLENL